MFREKEVKYMPKGESRAATNSYSKGQWNVNYLKFLTDFMDEMNLTTTTAAKTVGISRQSIYYWLTKDDAKISSIYRFFEAFGYDIIFDYEKKRRTATADISIEIRRETSRGEKNLTFLDEGLKRYKVNRAELLKKLQLSATTLCYWLNSDDIFISYIYKIAEASDLMVKVTIRPKASI